jgi:ribose 5-phosphate isomerase B
VRVYLGSDHAAFELKAHLIEHLRAGGHDPVDCGPPAYRPDDDYPPYVLLAATRTANEPDSRGIVLGGSGNGEAMAANKVPGVRCGLAWNEETARLAREHNDARIVSIGARMQSAEQATGFVDVFLATDFSGERRHVRRLAMVSDYERSGELPPPPADSGS